MRIGIFAIGFVLLFVGLLVVSISQAVKIETGQTYVTLKNGAKDVTELTDVNLNAADRFRVRYSGGGQRVNQLEIVVIVYDPYGNITTLDYVAQYQSGIIANYSGSYRIGLGAPGLIDPDYPFLMLAEKIIQTSTTTYPNSSMLPYGLAPLIIGAGISVWSAKSSKQKINRNRTRRRAIKSR
jgi:hypothetical protein